mmetsp:Transcript_8701/g.11529  ORF Transcript_8701/g.11529 Transcript_8701/m.11529 type:complete len:188 (+) Transcript_8701:192-755(+)
MSRAHTPPDTLTKDDRQTIAEVRKDIWVEGFYGLLVGSFAGLALHSGARLIGRYRTLPFTLDRNTAMASFMGGGAIGSFVLSVTKGKNQVHLLHPIFERGKKEGEDEDKPMTYEQFREKARERQGGIRVRRATRHILEDPEEERLERERNRLLRRNTLMNSMGKEGGGLNDSHGGHWVDERSDERSK